VNNARLGSFDTKGACESGGSAYMCWSGAPHALSDSVSYGFASANLSSLPCGQCFQIQFDGGAHSGGPTAETAAISGKQMIVQMINRGGVASDQFDLLIPGGGIGLQTSCPTQWATSASNLGSQYGGFLSGCKGQSDVPGCVRTKCATVFVDKPDLLAGCNWLVDWLHAADNPTFVYKTVTCPSDFKSVMGLL
jgi:hypothetical protein